MVLVCWEPDEGEPPPKWPIDEAQFIVAQYAVALLRDAWPSLPRSFRSHVDRTRIRLVGQCPIHELVAVVEAVEHADHAAVRDAVARVLHTPGGATGRTADGDEAALRGDVHGGPTNPKQGAA